MKSFVGVYNHSNSFLGTKAQSAFATLKKKYLRKKRDMKDTNKSGTSSASVLKAERALIQYDFMQWLDPFVQAREGRTNLPTKENIETIDESSELKDCIEEKEDEEDFGINTNLQTEEDNINEEENETFSTNPSVATKPHSKQVKVKNARSKVLQRILF